MTLPTQSSLKVPCMDCRTAPATRTFLHMTKGHFPLCDECFEFADHEDTYLEVCDCMHPDGKPDAVACRCCDRAILRCACETPAVWGRMTRCVDCSGIADRFFAHKERFVLFHEELMQTTWHPTRVARWLEAGEEVLDMMLGL